MNCLIDVAGIEDIPALHALVESAYRGDGARRGWTHEADLLGGQRTDVAALTEMLTDREQRVLVARDGDVIVGCVVVARRADGGYLGMLTVRPDVQAGGLGRQLLARAEAVAAQAFGARMMEMTVIRQRPELIAWYERRGYALTGETRPFPHGDDRFGLPTTAVLEFVVLAKPLAR